MPDLRGDLMEGEAESFPVKEYLEFLGEPIDNLRWAWLERVFLKGLLDPSTDSKR